MLSTSFVTALSTSLLGAFSLPFVSIMQIQGRGHTSPFAGDSVATTGTVTALMPNGFYLQDAAGDFDPSTSDGIFAFTGSPPTVVVGDQVRLEGLVSEFRPASDPTNLTVTEITHPRIEILARGQPLPMPLTLACPMPSEIIDNDALLVFDPESDGIDFYECMENMRVRVPDAVAVSVTNAFGELWVRGPCATGVNKRGGITISAGDMNPERIQIDDVRMSGPVTANVGDRVGDVVGVMSYRFGNFEVLPESIAEPVIVEIKPEMTRLRSDEGHLTVASFNVRNLNREDAERIAAIAHIIAINLGSPDILALQEIQDDSGSVNDGTVDARRTYAALIDAIWETGGPRYDFRDIAPEDGHDGGEPGANIRVGFLFRPDRVEFVDRGSARATTTTWIVEGSDGVSLSHSPGRIDPMNDAWRSSRKPLAAEFEFDGRRLFVIACHLTSRGGSTPLFGATQPPLIGGEAQRIQQASVTAAFVDRLLALDRSAAVVVLGDFNDFQFSPTLTRLRRDLVNLTDLLPPSERYSYNFEGNSQALDHILVSAALARGAGYDIVHVSSEFTGAASDHDPVVARLQIVSVEEEPAIVAFPNPFRAATRIAYKLERAASVSVVVYDVAGRPVRKVQERHEPSGDHDVMWDGLNDRRRPAPAGVYFVRVLASGVAETARVVRIP